MQKQLAERFGVNKATVHNWEANASEPGCAYMPSPSSTSWATTSLPSAATLAERLIRVPNIPGADPEGGCGAHERRPEHPGQVGAG